jgi:hypothetical protein
MREDKTVAALSDEPRDLETLVGEVYDDAPPMVKAGPGGGLAGLSLQTHLAKLKDEGRAQLHSDGRWSSR